MSFDKTFDGSDAHLMPADAAACVAFLRGYQAWRRFDGEIEEEGPAMPHPKSIGFAIDMAIRLIEERGELLAALEGLHKVCEIALSGKGGVQHTYFETRHGSFVDATEVMIAAESALSNAKGTP